MTVNAVDATGLSPAQITALAKNGVKTIGRYLSHSSWKTLNVGEVANLKAAGIQIFSIYESNPTKSSYFVPGKGKSDALDAVQLAKAVGQPQGSAIYFTVDYDAQAADLPKILSYFNEIQANLTDYKVGAYGSFTVLNYLHQNNAADYWFQTVAWSSGQRCSFLNLYQFQCDKTLAGVNVDFDNLEKDDIGAWGQPQFKKESVAAPIAKVIGTVTIDYPKNYGVNAYNAPGGTFVKKIPGQSSWKCWGENDEYYAIGGNLWVPKQYCIFHK